MSFQTSLEPLKFLHRLARLAGFQTLETMEGRVELFVVLSIVLIDSGVRHGNLHCD